DIMREFFEQSNLSITYDPNISITDKSLRNFDKLIPKIIPDCQTCLDQALPNYIRLSAAEMALEESKKLNH
ncbi:MAG: hypothetical protein ACRCTJ_05880, partial [Brevinema sp.]